MRLTELVGSQNFIEFKDGTFLDLKLCTNEDIQIYHGINKVEIIFESNIVEIENINKIMKLGTNIVDKFVMTKAFRESDTQDNIICELIWRGGELQIKKNKIDNSHYMYVFKYTGHIVDVDGNRLNEFVILENAEGVLEDQKLES